jgi:tetratricopeptide (TPR) repeat protein
MNKLASLFIVALLSVHVFARAASSDVTPEIERAILSEDWKKVSELVPVSINDSGSTTLRLIRGHACLALNQNNESLQLFLTTPPKQGIEEYESWAVSFANRYSDRTTAFYFKGDALARQAKWSDALAAFNSALKLKPNHALSLNARGVCYALGGEWDKSLEDFAAATIAVPSFSEAWANRGAMYIQRSTAAKGALSAFDAALKYSPESAVAKMGRACALFGAGKLDEAEKALAECQNQPETMDLVSINLSLVRDRRLSLAAKQLASADKGVGVSLKLDTQERVSAINHNLQEINSSRLDMDVHAAYNSGWANTLHDWSDVMKWGAKAASSIDRPDWSKTLSTLSKGAGFGGDITRSAADQYRNSSAAMDRQWQSGIKSLMETSFRDHPGSPQANAYERLYMHNTINSPPGGVSTDMSAARVDSGNWGVFVPYGILYTHVHFPDSKDNREK